MQEGFEISATGHNLASGFYQIYLDFRALKRYSKFLSWSSSVCFPRKKKGNGVDKSEESWSKSQFFFLSSRQTIEYVAYFDNGFWGNDLMEYNIVFECFFVFFFQSEKLVSTLRESEKA